MAKLKTLQEGLDEIRKLYGTASVFQANDSFKSNIQSIGTGSFNLNDTIGVGGIPLGRLIMLSGVESSGKSALALSIIKEAQKDGGVGYYIDGEYTFDTEWTQRLGVDLDRLFISQTNNAKEVFELLIGKPKNDKRQNAIPGVLMNEKILHSGLKVIVIDSIDSLAPPMEMDSEVGKSNMALMARFLPPELRRLTPMLGKAGVSIIAIMQARDVPGQQYGDALTVSGGRALKHAASVWIDLGVIGNSAITIDGRKDGEKIGHRIRAKIRKNKVAPPFKQAEFTIFFQRGIDVRSELPEQAVITGVITKESEKIYTYKAADGKDFRWNGMTQVTETIMSDTTLAKEIGSKVKEAKKKENEERLQNTNFKEEEVDETTGEIIEKQEVTSNEGADENEIENKLQKGSDFLKEKADTNNVGEKNKNEESNGNAEQGNKGLTESELEEKTMGELKAIAEQKSIKLDYKVNSKDKLIKRILEVGI